MKILLRILLFAFVAIGIYYFFHFDLVQIFTIENLKNQREWLVAYYHTHTYLFIALWAFLFLISSVLFLPIIGFLCVASGLLMGTLWGSFFAILFSSIGATLAFLTSRTLFGSMIRRHFLDQYIWVNHSLRKEGHFFLFTLRMIPVVPFTATNFIMGVTPIGAYPFFLVSLIGLTPATILYVHAGTELAQINSYKDIFSVSLIATLGVLGLLPYFFRILRRFFHKKNIINQESNNDTKQKSF